MGNFTMRIRGIFLQDYAKVVRDTPELNWAGYLTPQDKKILELDIIPTEWYPVEIMAHIAQGLFEMRAGSEYRLVREAGKARVANSFDEATRRFLMKDDPPAALRAYTSIATRFVDELEVKVRTAGENFCEVSFFPVDGAPAWDLFREIQAGTLEKLVELNGGQDPSTEFISETTEGRDLCIIRVTWKKG